MLFSAKFQIFGFGSGDLDLETGPLAQGLFQTSHSGEISTIPLWFQPIFAEKLFHEAKKTLEIGHLAEICNMAIRSSSAKHLSHFAVGCDLGK